MLTIKGYLKLRIQSFYVLRRDIFAHIYLIKIFSIHMPMNNSQTRFAMITKPIFLIPTSLNPDGEIFNILNSNYLIKHNSKFTILGNTVIYGFEN